MKYSKIGKLLEEKKITWIELCEKIDITPNGLRKMIAQENLKVKVLENIAIALRVPLNVFFEEALFTQEVTESKTNEISFAQTINKLTEMTYELQKENKNLLTTNKELTCKNAELTARLSIYEKREPFKNSA